MAINWLSPTGYIIVIATFVVCVGGLIVYSFYNRNRWRYKFELVSSDLKNKTTINARIKRDETNKKLRFFVFKDNDTRLKIKEPDFHLNGKPYRRITYDTTGDYIYLNASKIVDKTDYLTYSLEPEDKTITLQMFKEYANEYPLINKAALFTFAALVVIAILIVVGFIYVFASNVKQGEYLQEYSSNMVETANSQESVASSIERSSGVIYSAVAMLYNGTVIRPLEPVGVTG